MRHFKNQLFLRKFSEIIQRPFKILGLMEVAFAGMKKEEINWFWKDIMGLTYIRETKFEVQNLQEHIYSSGTLNSRLEIDLISTIKEMEGKNQVTSPFNHIGLWVDDLLKFVNYLKLKNINTIGGINKSPEGYDVVFINPISSG